MARKNKKKNNDQQPKRKRLQGPPEGHWKPFSTPIDGLLSGIREEAAERQQRLIDTISTIGNKYYRSGLKEKDPKMPIEPIVKVNVDAETQEKVGYLAAEIEKLARQGIGVKEPTLDQAQEMEAALKAKAVLIAEERQKQEAAMSGMRKIGQLAAGASIYAGAARSERDLLNEIFAQAREVQYFENGQGSKTVDLIGLIGVVAQLTGTLAKVRKEVFEGDNFGRGRSLEIRQNLILIMAEAASAIRLLDNNNFTGR